MKQTYVTVLVLVEKKSFFCLFEELLKTSVINRDRCHYATPASLPHLTSPMFHFVQNPFFAKCRIGEVNK